jgi:carbonic anhydrase
MDEIKKLLDGFDRFRARHYEHGSFKQLVHDGQAPKIMVIACCDSRVDPAIITDCDPGDLFVVRNVANLVPPYETTGHYHGTSAALEFAVRSLGVRHVVVLGHARCGGIRALLADNRESDESSPWQFLPPWMEIAASARAVAKAISGTASPADAERACEEAAIQVSLANLTTFPWVRRRVERRELSLHGWYFDMEHGELLRYDRATGRFTALG